MERKEIEPLTTRQILTCAMQNERAACETYCTIGESLQRADNPVTAKIFFEASKVEKGHFLKLQKVLYRLYGRYIGRAAPLPEAAACPSDFGDDWCVSEAKTDMSADEAIAFLEKAETGAEEYYRKAAEVTERPDLKALFRNLASEEGRHVRAVKKVARKSQSRRLPSLDVTAPVH